MQNKYDDMSDLAKEELEALLRFEETTDDDGTYDISKEMLKALSKKDILIHVGFGQYQITEKGELVIKEWNKRSEV